MRKIYVVMGSTGEYSDHREWPVCSYSSEKAAAQRVVDCTASAARFDKDDDTVFDRYSLAFFDEEQKAAANPLDPQINVSYTGVQYSFFAIDLIES